MTNYRQSGVDIAAGTRATQLMADAVRATHGPAVLAGLGAFGGCFALDTALGAAAGQAVLVASTDGVGTKTIIATQLGRYDSIGQDLVNHCINDILVQGAKPLFFMDYIAMARLNAEHVATIVAGVAQACQAAGCALLGGETAEMPDIYLPGTLDLAGTIIGAVSREHMLPRNVAIGDVLIALPSNGLHTNGYSLARRVLGPLGYESRPELLGGASIGEALLAIHRSYLPAIDSLRSSGVALHGLAHITGGGILDNLPRVLPEGVGALIRTGSWPVPAIIELLVAQGQLEEQEAFHALNMGVGMLAIVAPESVEQALQVLPEAYRVGELIQGSDVVLV